MTKKTKPEPTKNIPTFYAGQLLGSGGPFVAADENGVAWRIDPETGIGTKVVFK